MFEFDQRRLGLATVLAASVALTGCFGDDDNNSNTPDTEMPGETPNVSTYEYEVTLLNATVGQPLSPIALLVHNDSYQTFAIGSAASTELEYLAEAGSNSQLLEAVVGNTDVYSSQSGAGIVAPGASETLTISIEESQFSSAQLTLLTMMVNTNDAVVAIQGVELAGLSLGESLHLKPGVYDSGTEANSESDASVPGPAAGGEGFNSARDDLADQVTQHPGVLTADDGLPTSALSELHRWDNPAAMIQIERTQ